MNTSQSLLEVVKTRMRKTLSRIFRAVKPRDQSKNKVDDNEVNEQDLDIYWDKEFAELLDTWGESHVWKEIQLLLKDVEGPVLDIACGTGVAMRILSDSLGLDVYGCDISEMLIEKAVARGISVEKLEVCDATRMANYGEKQFTASYSIGSLEHFTVEGIDLFLSEAARVTQGESFHQIPMSISGRDEGWISPHQSYFNNSQEWWRTKFEKYFSVVQFLPSGWEDDTSIGVWVCCKGTMIKNVERGSATS